MKESIYNSAIKKSINEIYQALSHPNKLAETLVNICQVLEHVDLHWKVEDLNEHSLLDCIVIKDGKLSASKYSSSRHDNKTNNNKEKKIVLEYALNNNRSLSICFQRSEQHYSFKSSEIEFINQLSPHFIHYVNIAYENGLTNKTNKTLEITLDRINRPIWIVNNKLKIIFSNKTANDCSTTTNIDNKFLVDNINFKKQFETLIKSQNDDKKHYNLNLTHQDIKQSLWIYPLDQQQDNSLFMICGREYLPEICQIKVLFGLSDRQSQVCWLLMQGNSIQNISIEINKSYNTVRNTLYNCFRKLDVKNQSELISRLYSGIRVID